MFVNAWPTSGGGGFFLEKLKFYKKEMIYLVYRPVLPYKVSKCTE